MKDKREQNKEQMKGQDCCKKIYQAFDGEIFLTKEECKTYTEKPRIFKVSVTDIGVYRDRTLNEEYYLDYNTAKAREEYFIKYFSEQDNTISPYIKFEQITFEDYNNEIELIQEDKEVKQELTKEKQSKVNSLWENIKSYFKNRDSDKENT